MLSQCFITAHAANSYIPELNVYQNGSSPKIEIGVDMDDADVYFIQDFSNSSTYSLKCGSSNSNGNQEVVNNVYHLKNTVDTWTGNEWWTHYNQTKSQVSRFMNSATAYPEDGSWLSVSVHAKGTGNNTSLASVLQARKSTYRGVATAYTFAEDVDFNTKPIQVKVNVPRGMTGSQGVDVVTVKGTDSGDKISKSKASGSINNDTGIMTLNIYQFNISSRSKFYEGENVLVYSWLSSSITKDIQNDNQWHYINYNQKLLEDSSLYSFRTKGMENYFRAWSNGDLYIDAIKVGKASKVQVMRDNTTQIYNDYGSDVVDNSLVVKPNAPTISSRITLKDKVQFKYSALVKQEAHNYRARSLGSSGNNPSSWSRNYPVTLVSTPSKYHIKLYKNGTLVKDVDTSTTFEYADVKRGDRLTGEVYTIDTRNQKSNSTVIDYTVGQTVPDLKDDIRNFISSVEDSNDVGGTISQTSLLSLRTNTNIPYSINSVNISKATKYNTGSVNVDASINSTSVPYQKEITNRPIYQTKEEFKSDVTNYIDTGNISSDISFKDFKDNIKEVLENKLNEECKDNPDLNDVEVEIEGTSTEFSSGDAEVKVYYKNS